jgi:predicted metal-dependent phosphoesterase TrpH
LVPGAYFVIDPHVHTPASACGRTTFPGLLSWASRKNLNGIVVTDHDTFQGVEIMKRLAKGTELTVYRGVELTTLEGHLLLLGGTELPPSGQISTAEILDLVNAEGGVAIAAHPFRRVYAEYGQNLSDLVYELDLDGVELNAKCSKSENTLARKAAKIRNLALLGGSDAHRDQELGTMVTGFYDSIENEDDLILAIRARRCRPLTYY